MRSFCVVAGKEMDMKGGDCDGTFLTMLHEIAFDELEKVIKGNIKVLMGIIREFCLVIFICDT